MTRKSSAPEEVSLASTKKQKSAKCTPSKAKNIEEPEPVKKGVESTSAAKKDQAKTSNVVDLKDGQWSSSAKGKKKTPSKLNEPVVATPQMTAPKETKKTASAKGKKEKIPTKIHSATPSKELEKLILKARETCAESKETPKSPPDAVDFAPASKTPKPGKKSIEKPGSVPAPEPADKKNKPIHDIQDPDVLLHEEDGQIVFEEDDENTKALVRSLDSGDEDDFESGVVLFEEGQDVGKIPVVSKKDEKAAKKALTALRNKEDTGVIYVGRLPHGFYEHEMRSYFSQFGHICNLRVSRNKKTGKAKHFAFVEFAETSTAEIAAKTMDNYLLFGHIIKCRVIPKAQIHDDLFKGANKRFKVRSNWDSYGLMAIAKNFVPRGSHVTKKKLINCSGLSLRLPGSAGSKRSKRGGNSEPRSSKFWGINLMPPRSRPLDLLGRKPRLL